MKTRQFLLLFVSLFCTAVSIAQTDTTGKPVTDTIHIVSDTFPVIPISDTLPVLKDTVPRIDTFFTITPVDTILRIRNLNPYITLHVDSTLEYELEINKQKENYYWYLTNSPVGLKINRSTGTLSLKGEKALFLSGRLKYDHEYKVRLGVQNLDKPKDKVDTAFTLIFFNTEIIPAKIKPNVGGVVYVNEGDSINFKIQCEGGSFPIEQIMMTSNYPIKTMGVVTRCGDEFKWSPAFGFVKGTDTVSQRTVTVNFVGANKFNVRDTATVRIVVKENINYPQKAMEHNDVVKSINHYSNRLKATFMDLDKQVKKTRGTRTSFELGSAATALGGTVFSSLPNEGQKTAGKILPSAGVAMVPVKETVAPNKTAEQKANSATLIRNSIKRLEYLLQNNRLVGDKDPEILNKTQKLRDGLREIQTQLIEVPVIEVSDSPEELDKYFNNPKVNKKYRMRRS